MPRPSPWAQPPCVSTVYMGFFSEGGHTLVDSECFIFSLKRGMPSRGAVLTSVRDDELHVLVEVDSVARLMKLGGGQY